MSLMDLKCEDSICCSKSYVYVYTERESLLLGKDKCCDYIIYLYFNLPPYSYLKYLKQARLILFKLPTKCEEFMPCSYFINQNSKYSAYPLLDFFSIYSCMFCTPRIDENLKVNFEDTGCCSYTEIDITTIVKSWTEEKIENKGLILMGDGDARLIGYASNNYCMNGMRPRMRLIYDENYICPPLTATPCVVDLDRHETSASNILS